MSKSTSNDPSNGLSLNSEFTLSAILPKLKKIKKVKGNGKFMALCPCHDDRTPSLSIREVSGTVLFHCFAGCSPEQIRQSLGIGPKRSYSTAEITGSTQEDVEKIYRYEDETGALLYEMLRNTGKKFVARKPSAAGGREYNLLGVRRVLYRLPKLVAARSLPTGDQPFVFICEGEKDVENLEQLGLLATCNPNGAGKWQNDYSASLAGFHCIVLPDNDEPGRQHGEQVARSLRGVAASVRVACLPDLPDKGDVSDWLEQGGTAAELIEIAKRQPKYGAVKVSITSAPDLLGRIFPDLRWAVFGILPEGLALFVGKPKLGKSWVALGIAIAVSSGGNALGVIPVEPGDVLYLSLEDGQRRLQRRLKGMLVNNQAPSRLEIATEWPKIGSGGIEAIEDWLEAHPAARLIVIDTLKRVRPTEQPNSRLYDGDYDAVAPLTDLAGRYGVCILLIHHTRKADSTDVIDLASGTHGLTGAADAVLVLKRARGEADATLHATGRDFEDRDIALRWDDEICGFRMLGDAAEFNRSPERQEIINLLRTMGPRTPKAVAKALKREYQSTKKLLWTMKRDGELIKMPKARYAVSSGNPGNLVTENEVN